MWNVDWRKISIVPASQSMQQRTIGHAQAQTPINSRDEDDVVNDDAEQETEHSDSVKSLI
eukprot:snap_masked-scaffold_102-processed-gene-0.28-mRNA-1 protein AED:1.00 eAED:1.00 QI:0/0/0/0/1/1/2/0/59